MLTLGIDSSGSVASTALVDGGKVLASVATSLHLTHSETLLLSVDKVLSETGRKPSDVGCIGVTTGPGSFTGLRVGLGTARGLSASRGIGLVGVPTVEAVSFHLRERGIPVCVVLPSRRGYVYRAVVVWERRADIWAPLRTLAEANVPEEQILSEIVGPMIVVGEGIARISRPLALMNLPGVEVLPPENPAEVGTSTAIIAELKSLAGQSVRASELKPFYVHHDVATMPKHRR